MTFVRVLSFALTAVVHVIAVANAQVASIDDKDRAAFQEEADIWLDTVFGHCLFKVSGETFLAHPADLQGEWQDLRPDYASTLLKPLHDPRESVLRRATILDISPGGESCWTQHSTILPEYISLRLGEIQNTLEAQDRLKTALVDQGLGPQQVAVILVGESRIPVILYQSVTQNQGFIDVVTVVQKTLPGFVYSD